MRTHLPVSGEATTAKISKFARALLVVRRTAIYADGHLAAAASSAASAARSAVTAKRVSAWSRKATASMVAASSLRVSIPAHPGRQQGKNPWDRAAGGPNRSFPAGRVQRRPAEWPPPDPRPACAAACPRCRETRLPQCRAGTPSTARGAAGCWFLRERHAAAQQDSRG